MSMYLYSEKELNEKSIEQLDQLLVEHGYDVNDFVDKAFRVEVLSNIAYDEDEAYEAELIAREQEQILTAETATFRAVNNLDDDEEVRAPSNRNLPAIEQDNYVMLNGFGNAELGHIVRIKGTNEDGTVQVLDELSNGYGKGYAVPYEAIVPMSKSDYDKMFEWLCDTDESAMLKIEAMIRTVLR